MIYEAYQGGGICLGSTLQKFRILLHYMCDVYCGGRGIIALLRLGKDPKIS